MFLTQISLAKVVKKQYLFKLKAYLPAFGTLVGLQLFALFLSLSGVGSMGTGSDMVDLNVTFYSADIVIVFTMLWACIMGIVLTTKPYRNGDFAFVSNRLSSHLANVLFLVTVSVVGGVSAILCRFPLKVLLYYLVNSEYMNLKSTFSSSYLELGMGSLVTIFYVLLLGAVGYFVGTLVQLNRLFVVVIPVLVVGTLIYAGISGRDFIIKMFNFFVNETSLSLFLVKILAFTGIILTCSIVLLNRLEVRR